MSAELLRLLVQMTLCSSAAIVLVAILRKPLRHVVGAGAAYRLWMLVPACALAVLLPMPAPEAPSPTHSVLPELSSRISAALIVPRAADNSWNCDEAWLLGWLVGACLMAAWLTFRQRAFVRSLGPLVAGPDGILRSVRVCAPMVVGAWRPRVIVPADFEARYPEEDRRLMLAHELAHRERGDTRVNSIAALWLCAFWFNPLAHWALGRIRFDQELACDAIVVSRSASGTRRYANALLSAQLTSESAWRVPAGCFWQSNHPLKERIAMLKFSSPALSRRLLGMAFTVGLAAFGMYFVSTSYAQPPAAKAAEAADPKFSIEAKDTDTREVLRLIASKGGRNVLVGDQVGGKITVQLKDVTWREALDIVVQSQGLVTRQSGNITIVDVAK
jgi:beta-lactamase regulating signal transducer with metallopeptidase domain